MEKPGLTAEQFAEQLSTLQDPSKREGYERALKADEVDRFIGVRMGDVFKTAKQFKDLPLDEVAKVLDSPIHEMRVGAVSIMDFQARGARISEEHRAALFDLYMRKHDRINGWDLVDRAAPRVVGAYLYDKPRDVLFELAGSPRMAERRTALVSTLYFISQGDTADALRLSELLLHDEENLIQRAVGWVLRSVGGPELIEFLDKHVSGMPSITLSYATEKLSKEERAKYRKLR